MDSLTASLEAKSLAKAEGLRIKNYISYLSYLSYLTYSSYLSYSSYWSYSSYFIVKTTNTQWTP